MAEKNGAATETFDQLRDDIAGLQDQIKELIRSAGDAGSHGISAARDKAAQTAKKYAGIAADRSHQSVDLITDYVQRHPVASLAGAALIGAFLARSLHRD
ncbi:MAG: hypothetical protein ABI439_10425 [Rhodospirillales bacterium]